jgi:hypothetical protein
VDPKGKDRQTTHRLSESFMKQEDQDKQSDLDRQQEEWMEQFHDDQGKHDHGKFQKFVTELFKIHKSRQEQQKK